MLYSFLGLLYVLLLGWVSAGTVNLAPKSQASRLPSTAQLDINRLRGITHSEDFLRAADFFNHNALGHPLSWETLISLYEIFRADDKNPKYTAETRKERLNTVTQIFPRQLDIRNARQALHEDGDYQGSHYQNFLQTLDFYKQSYPHIEQCIDIEYMANSKVRDNPDYLITLASRIYAYIVNQQIFKFPGTPSESSFLQGLPGFDSVYSILPEYQNCTYDGHHTLSWFIVNYLLMSNGYQPLYFSPEDIQRISGHGYNYERIYKDIERLLTLHVTDDNLIPVPDKTNGVGLSA